MEELAKSIYAQAPIIAALLLFMGFLLKWIGKLVSDANQKFEGMHKEALQRHSKSDEAWKQAMSDSAKASEEFSKVAGRTMVILERVERRLERDN